MYGAPMFDRRMFAVAAPLLIAGCWGRGFGYEGGIPQDTAAPVAVDCGGDLDLSAGINIMGTAIDLETGLPVALAGTTSEPLCVAAIDPGPAVVNLPPEYLVTSTLCPDGTYILSDLPVGDDLPLLGVMVGVYDCEDPRTGPSPAGKQMRTVTGIAREEFDGMVAGDSLEGVTAWSVSASFLATMQAALDPAAPDLAASGFLAGFVTDASGAPVSGATVTCETCSATPTYYSDATPDDGLYGDGGTFNTATSADASGQFLIPAAPITTYEADDGGAHTWGGELFGSLPGYGVFIQFDGE